MWFWLRLWCWLRLWLGLWWLRFWFWLWLRSYRLRINLFNFTFNESSLVVIAFVFLSLLGLIHVVKVVWKSLSPKSLIGSILNPSQFLCILLTKKRISRNNPIHLVVNSSPSKREATKYQSIVVVVCFNDVEVSKLRFE